MVSTKKILITVLVVINLGLLLFAVLQERVSLTKLNNVEVLFKREVSDFVGVNIFIKNLKAAEAYKGLANLTMKMLDKGTKTSDKYQLANRLEEIGAKVSYRIYDDFGLISAVVVKENVEELFQYLRAGASGTWKRAGS